MKVIVSGGGTGGHIYPAISIAKEIMDKHKDAQVLFVGTEKGLESKLVSKEHLEFRSVRVKGFRRKLSADTLKTMLELLRGIYDASRILRDFRPDIVIGTGGYVAGPVLIMAAFKGIPTLIHEQNVLPGVTNRILARFADKVAISFKESVEYFGDKDKVVFTGNPVRKEILKKDRDTSIMRLGFEKDRPLVLVFGGSKGSAAVNRVMEDVICRLKDERVFQLLHVTGSDHYSDSMSRLHDRGIFPERISFIKVVEYMHDMPDALAAADLIVTSAGAITIAEITALGIPSILVPKSHAANNHQEYNARALENSGAAVVILEKELKEDILYTQLIQLVKDKNALKHMEKASRKMGRIDALDRIYRMITELTRR